MDFNTVFNKKNLFEFIKFALVGASGTILNILILWFLTEILGFYYIISEIIAFIISGVNNYIWNKIWTFKESLYKKTLIKYLYFLFISIISLTVNVSILYLLVEFFDMWYILAEIFAIGCAFIFNYIGNKLWTFRDR